MRATRIAAIIVLLVAGMASSVLAQRPVETERPAPGWIGISFGFTGNRLGTVTAAWITEVRPGSPAETAGLQAGTGFWRSTISTVPRSLAPSTSYCG